MGLFDKKYCDICGEKIGLLGNRKLEDGNLCKDCAKKLSPFFSDRRRSTVEDIKRQLAYRAENKKELEHFYPRLTFGERKKVHMDPQTERFIVTGLSDWRSGNPDLIKFSQVYNVETDIRENKEEIYYEDSDGNKKSYNPRRFNCDYEFNVTICVDSPWFSEIELELSDGNRPESRYSPLYRNYEQMMQQLADLLMRRDDRFLVRDGDAPPKLIGIDGRQIGSDSVHDRPADSAPATQPVGELWQCPSCGASSSGKKFCENCGAMKPAAPSGCKNCGWTPAPGQSMSKFCPECGKPLT